MTQYGSKMYTGGFCSKPTIEHECWVAIWSQGRACKSCQANCYRKGWSKEQATTDNKQLVTVKTARGSKA